MPKMPKRTKKTSPSNTGTNNEETSDGRLCGGKPCSKVVLCATGILLIGITRFEIYWHFKKESFLFQSVGKTIRELPAALTNNGTFINGDISLEFPEDNDFESAVQGELSSIHDELSAIYNENYSATHASDTEILGLTDWEQASLDALLNIPHITPNDAIRTCKPPDGIDTTCCIGTFSAGGGVNPALRASCAKGFDQWEELQTAVNTFFQENPIPKEDESGRAAMKCDACRIVELARANNINITMIGDSMHSQVYDGLKCELSRRGYIVEETIQTNPVSASHFLYRNIAHTYFLTIKSPLWNEEETASNKATSPKAASSVTLAFNLLYLMPTAEGCDHIVKEILSSTQVLVLGMGLHWKTLGPGPMAKSKYGPAVAEFIDRAYHDNISTVELVVHRETSAQHFDIPGGDYVEWEEDKSRNRESCVAAIRGRNSKWREPALRNATETAGYNFIVAGPDMPAPRPKKDVVVLPYYDFTEKFHTAHHIGSVPGRVPDCTHYCSSPFMYMTLWRSLRLAMERQYSPQ